MPVVPSPFADIVALSDVKPFLRIPDADVSQDAKLQGFIDAVTPLIENVVGAVTGTSYIEFYNGGASRIVLNHSPIMTVTSIVEYFGSGSSYTLNAAATPYDMTAGANAYWVENTSGVVTRVWSGYPGPFQGGFRSIQVTYTAGRSVTPANVRMATLEAIREMYEQTQLGGRPRFGGDALEDTITPNSPFALSYRVLEYLQPHRNNFGIG